MSIQIQLVPGQDEVSSQKVGCKTAELISKCSAFRMSHKGWRSSKPWKIYSVVDGTNTALE